MSAAAPTVPFTAIVLAAQRDGRVDPLAVEAGVTHKCLLPILDRPLIGYVVEALAAAPGISAVRICIEPAAVEPVRAALEIEGGFGVPIEFVDSRATITDSVYAAAQGIAGAMLFTTGDNVNLTPDAVAQAMAPLAQGYDGALALARREAVLAARFEEHRINDPTSKVGPYRFADGAFSNCNLYAVAGPRVLEMAEAFREGGQFSKKRKRLIRIVGLLNIVLLATRLLTVEQAMRRLSRRFGFQVKAVVLADGSQAVDVDNPRAYEVSKKIIERRRAA